MSFEEHFSELQDGRTDINISYDLMDVIFLTIAALLSGAEGWQDIQRFGDGKLEWLRRYRPFNEGIPRRHTIARIIGALSPDNLLDCFVSWVNEVRDIKGQEHVAIDGKTLRGSRQMDKHSALHLLSAMAIDSGLVIYQQLSAGKKNEIKTVQELLDVLDVRDACVTLDAMHCQTATVKKLHEKSADYVIQIKHNQKHFYQEIEAYFHKTERDSPESLVIFDEADKGHGRLEQRTYSGLPVSDWLTNASDWTGLKSIVRVTRRIEKGDKRWEEISYYLTSLEDNIQAIAEKIRRHWHIENSQHWVLDVVFKEDDSRIRVGDGPQNMALFRRFALNIARGSSIKDSIKGKLKQASWNDEVRAKLLFG